MFLRSNLRLSGIVHTGEPYSADYVGAYDTGQLVAVAAHSWGGNLLIEAPRELEALVCAALEHSRRELRGVVGSGEQVQATRQALGLSGAETTLDSREDLFALDLGDLVVPPGLSAPGRSCRPPRESELELLTQWRVAYEMEALGAQDGAELRRTSREEIERYQRDARHWVLEEAGRPVSYSAFNAQLPDCVQIGGVYTPPSLRRGRRARAVVAGSLLLARAAGATRSLLFTATDNHAAQRAYRALGYECVGDYAILLFAQPQRPV